MWDVLCQPGPRQSGSDLHCIGAALMLTTCQSLNLFCALALQLYLQSSRVRTHAPGASLVQTLHSRLSDWMPALSLSCSPCHCYSLPHGPARGGGHYKSRDVARVRPPSTRNPEEVSVGALQRPCQSDHRGTYMTVHLNEQICCQEGNYKSQVIWLFSVFPILMGYFIYINLMNGGGWGCNTYSTLQFCRFWFHVLHSWIIYFVYHDLKGVHEYYQIYVKYFQPCSLFKFYVYQSQDLLFYILQSYNASFHVSWSPFLGTL